MHVAPAATLRKITGALAAAGCVVWGCQAGVPYVVGTPSMGRFSDTMKVCNANHGKEGAADEGGVCSN